ncbi:MAG: CBS domain-containing protein [Gemmataceae bacterium]|nr:CBS domain-containing protein [Gemmataceae bacterium]
MQVDRSNIVVCPFCGAENIEGEDTCQNCAMDLRTTDVPETSQAISESQLLTPVGRVRHARPATVAIGASVREGVALLVGEPSGACVVMDGERIVGIFTERDVLKRIAGRPERFDDPLARWMTPDPVVLRDDDTVAAALNKMGSGGFRHIPLLRKGELVGMVTGRELLQWVMGRYFDEEAGGERR